LSEAIVRAVILAAGRGTRMGEMTDEIPKPMLPVRGRPMLAHILDGLATAGVRRFFIVAGHRHETIEQHFSKWPLPIEFCVQHPVDGTGSAARLAQHFAVKDPFLLTYGDILCDPAEYQRCGRVLDQDPAIAAVVAVKAVDDPWQGAAVYENEGRIQRIVEKPAKGVSTTRWNSAGFYAFRPVVFDYLARLQPSPRKEYELTSAVEMMLEDGLDLRISPVQGSWRDVGRPDDLAAANTP
jgi:dTDP-glucose pyrophosphorylase